MLAHELTHVKRRHPLWSWVLAGGQLVPLLGPAYSRACEYTCDATAAPAASGRRAGRPLVLAAGKRLHRLVDPVAFADQVRTEAGFWVRLTELLSSHPTLPRRVAALQTAPVRPRRRPPCPSPPSASGRGRR